MPTVRAHLVIFGRVQGVCFRMEAEREAGKRHLTGWVRNLRTGQVETVAEGEKEAVDEFVRWCHSGPSTARVTEVQVTWEKPVGDFTDFQTVSSV